MHTDADTERHAGVYGDTDDTIPRHQAVPATYRIHYEICVYNDSDVALTNVIIVDRWSPTSRAYLPPDNPLEKLWNIGTVEPRERRCVQFWLNTYSTAGGYTVTNKVIMTCDQGTGEATETTRIGPTPTITPTATPTATNTPRPQEIPTPTQTSAQVPTPTK